MTIFDCTMFFNENDIYELRFHQHKHFVDQFIVIESRQTHTGLSKPLLFDHSRYSEYKHRIHYRVVDNLDELIEQRSDLVDHRALSALGPAHNYQDFLRDQVQFNYTRVVLQELAAQSSDIVYFSCLDEILKSQAMTKCREILDIDHNAIFSFGMELYVYKINLLHKTSHQHHAGNLAQYHLLENVLPGTLRQHAKLNMIIPAAGWHFTFQDPTDGERVLAKQRSWAHSRDINPGQNTKFSNTTKQQAVSRLFQDYAVNKVDITEHTHPAYIVSNLDKFKDYIYQEQL